MPGRGRVAVGVYETGFSRVRRAVVPRSMSIVLRVVASQCSHSCGVCGRSSTGTSVTLQIVQRPSWARWSRWTVWLIGRALSCRRLAQYSVRAGSSGDAAPRPSGVGRCWSRQSGGMNAPLLRSPNTHRSCLALLNLPKYRANDPGRRLVRVAEGRPLVGELPQVLIQLAEDLGGYLCPVVGGPPADDRVEPFDHRPERWSRAGTAARCGAVPGSV